MAYTLRVITTVRPRRRRETSRASAEERIRTADARETEDLVATQIELRCILLDRIDRSELEPPTEGQHEADQGAQSHSCHCPFLHDP